MNPHGEKGVVAGGFVLALAILLAVSIVSYNNTAMLHANTRWVEHTYTVLQELDDLEHHVRDAATMPQRLAGEELLTRKAQAREDIEGGLGRVARLTRDNIQQQVHLAKLRPQVQRFLAVLAASVPGVPSGARTTPANTLGAMTSVTMRISAMQGIERSLLRERSQRVQSNAWRSTLAWMCGTGFSLLLLIGVFRVLSGEVDRRTKLEARLHALNEQLEDNVAARTRELEIANRQIKSIYAHLEQRVVERTAQLEQANQELEAFSYSVSHDLRAPLRALDGFSRILVEDYAAQLDEEALDYLQMIRDNAGQMGNLVDDLLTFSRLSRQSLETQVVDMTALMRHVIRDLAPETGGREIEWQVDALPAAQGDPSLLKQVVINLLSNAVKYSKNREKALIHVGCIAPGAEDKLHPAPPGHDLEAGDDSGEEAIYFVRDNGVGFDMEYSHKLFGVFQRLHRSEEYEGTGVGLAIVQRIVHRHGGRVWVQAAVEQGATFYFTLKRGANNA